MYAALSSNGYVVYASQLADNHQEQLFCPDCHQPLILKISSRGKRFFSHLTACGSGADVQRQGEGDRHLAIKQWFYQQYLTANLNVQMEAPLDPLLNRPDLLIKKACGTMQVLEIQCSPISGRQMMFRTKAYESISAEVEWLIDKESLSGNLQQAWFKRNVQWNEQFNYHVKAFDLVTKKIWVYHQLPLIFTPTQTVYQVSIYEPDVTNESLIKPSKIHGFSRRLAKPHKHHDRHLVQVRQSQAQQKYLHDFYEQGINIQDLPKWLIINQWESLVFKTHPWVVLTWIYVELRKETTVTLPEFKQLVLRVLRDYSIELKQLPFIQPEKYLEQLIVEIFQIFIEHHTIELQAGDAWKVKQR